MRNEPLASFNSSLPGPPNPALPAAGHVNPSQLVWAGCPGAACPLPVVGRDRGEGQLPCPTPPHTNTPANTGCWTMPQQRAAAGQVIPKGALHPVIASFKGYHKAREGLTSVWSGAFQSPDFLSDKKERNIYPPWDKMNNKK